MLAYSESPGRARLFPGGSVGDAAGMHRGGLAGYARVPPMEMRQNLGVSGLPKLRIPAQVKRASQPTHVPIDCLANTRGQGKA